MTKRLVDIDDAVLAAAQEALGTTTIKGTVHTALAEAAALTQRRRFVERMVDDGLPDLRDPSVSASAWR
jgi:Arc/MetJ family transcription regulator